jgi:hypothetical protein
MTRWRRLFETLRAYAADEEPRVFDPNAAYRILEEQPLIVWLRKPFDSRPHLVATFENAKDAQEYIDWKNEAVLESSKYNHITGTFHKRNYID